MTVYVFKCNYKLGQIIQPASLIVFFSDVIRGVYNKFAKVAMSYKQISEKIQQKIMIFKIYLMTKKTIAVIHTIHKISTVVCKEIE